MAYNSKFKAKVKADFEAGLTSKTLVAQKHGISRNTLKKFARDEGWEWGKNDQELTEAITKRTTEKLADEFSYELEDFTRDHLKSLGSIEQLTKASISRLAKEIKEQNNKVTKEVAEAIFSQQKFLKIATETLEIGYKNKRMALGMDKEEKGPSVIVAAPTQIIIEGIDPDADTAP